MSQFYPSSQIMKTGFLAKGSSQIGEEVGEELALERKRSSLNASSSLPLLTGGESFRKKALAFYESSVGARVDWCTLTWEPPKNLDVPAFIHALLTKFMGGVMGQTVPPMLSYAYGCRFYVCLGGVGESSMTPTALHVARLDFGGERHKGRARLDISGAGCVRISDWVQLSQVFSAFFDPTLTRVDLAVDALDGEFTVDDAVQWYHAGELGSGGRMPRHSLIGDWLHPLYGRTIEFGRRENGKMLRVYEKGRQLGDSNSKWTRFEVEFRNISRDIPLDILVNRDSYFVGAYKCLQRVLEASSEKIKTHQKDGEISIELLISYASTAYGKVFTALRAAGFCLEEIFQKVSRPGFPRRLDKASLAGFFDGSPPDLILRS